MNPLDNVWQLVKDFTSSPKHVQISDVAIESWLPKLSEVSIEKEIFPACIESVRELVLFELIANSVNYCYWYGKPDVRPCGSGATKMYSLLENAWSIEYDRNFNQSITFASFKSSLIHNRFPLISERLRHLDELEKSLSRITNLVIERSQDIEDCLSLIITSFPGYAQDMFLKRASLFFMQVNRRRCNLFENQINLLPVPADYQVPKMLEYMGILIYSEELKNAITNYQTIPSGSLIECEIRASTIEACRRLSERSGKTISTIDYWLWLNRKSCTNNFHLTVTTDY